MKRILITFTLGMFFPFLAFSQGWKPTPNDTLRSVVVNPDCSVDFQIYAPEATKVSVSSGDLPKISRTTFVKQDNGVWKGHAEGVETGVFRYNFVVNGVNVYDPKAPAANETTATFTMAPNGDEYFLKKDVPHGAISVRYYHSNILGTTRRLHIWTPPGYEKSYDKLPVLYLLHGGGGSDVVWSEVGCAGNILDNLLAEGKLTPMIVVMPNRTLETAGMAEPLPTFADELVKSIIPFIESNYRVAEGQTNRALAGLSMGGLDTLDAILDYYKEFSYFYVLSSGWQPSNPAKNIPAKVAKLNSIASDLKRSVKKISFKEGGPEDMAYKNGMITLGYFDEAGIKYDYSEAPGGHTWLTWRRDLHDLAPELFK